MFILRFSRALAKFKLFWFFSVGIACRQKPNVLECALALLACCLTFPRLAQWRFKTVKLSTSMELDKNENAKI